MKKGIILSALTVFLAVTVSYAQKFNGLDMNMGNLSRLSDAKSRSISPENFTGEKGKLYLLKHFRIVESIGCHSYLYLMVNASSKLSYASESAIARSISS